MIRADHRSLPTHPEPERHGRIVRRLDAWIRSELRFAKDFARLEISSTWAEWGCASVVEYGSRHGYRVAQVRGWVVLGKALQAVPHLEAAIVEHRVPIEQAEIIAPLLLEPGLEKERHEWLDLAERTSPRRLRSYASRRLEQVRQAETDLQPITIWATRGAKHDWHRACDVVRMQARRQVSEGEVFARIVGRFLDGEDPVRRAARIEQRRGAPNGATNGSSGSARAGPAGTRGSGAKPGTAKPDTAKPDTAKPDTGKPDTGKPDTGNAAGRDACRGGRRDARGGASDDAGGGARIDAGTDAGTDACSETRGAAPGDARDDIGRRTGRATGRDEGADTTGRGTSHLTRGTAWPSPPQARRRTQAMTDASDDSGGDATGYLFPDAPGDAVPDPIEDGRTATSGGTSDAAAGALPDAAPDAPPGGTSDAVPDGPFGATSRATSRGVSDGPSDGPSDAVSLGASDGASDGARERASDGTRDHPNGATPSRIRVSAVPGAAPDTTSPGGSPTLSGSIPIGDPATFLDPAAAHRRRPRRAPRDPEAKRRHVPAGVRRLVWLRAGGMCEIPGCHARRDLQLCHIRAWARGGANGPWNLLLLCPRHHLLLDAGRIRFLRWEERRASFRLPGGTVLHPEARAPPGSGPAEEAC